MMKKRDIQELAISIEPKWMLSSSGVILGLMLTLLLSGCAHRTQSTAPPKNGAIVVKSQSVSPSESNSTSTTEEAVVEIAETDAADTAEVDGTVDDTVTDDFDDFFEEEQVAIADPLEPVNRAIFAFNDKLYFWVFKPVANTFKAVVPEEIRISTSNAFHNIKAPVRIANSLLQGKLNQAGTEFGRFFINSTVGVLGFGDPAAEYPFFISEHDREDLGQTLAIWGIKDGVYLVLPFLGPSTLRDAVGTVGDRFLNPLTYGLDETSETLGVKAYETVNALSFRLGQYEALKEGSLDPYVFMKNAYLQIRQDKISK